jgi:hypothetical protein
MSADRKQGASDLVRLDPNRENFIVNIHDNAVAPVVHQFDRCHPWVGEWFATKEDMVGPNKGRPNVEAIRPVPWLAQGAPHPLEKPEASIAPAQPI